MSQLQKVLLFGHQMNGGSPSKSVLLTTSIRDNIPEGAELWTLSPVTISSATEQVSSVLSRGPEERSFLFQSSYEVKGFSQLNQEFLNVAFPRFLAHLSPGIVHFVDPHLIGLELIWIVRNTLPSTKIVVSLSDASSLCILNGLLLKSDGQLCDGPSVASCKACDNTFNPDSHFLKLNLVDSAFQLVSTITAPKSRLAKVLMEKKLHSQPLEFRPFVKSSTYPTFGHAEPDALKSTKRFAYFGPVCGQGMHLLVEAMRSMSSETCYSIDVYPTDSGESKFEHSLKKFGNQPGLFIQTAWSQADFHFYLSDYCATILPSSESPDALHWAETSLELGLKLIRSHRLVGLDGPIPTLAIPFLEGSSMSLVAAMKNAAHRDNVNNVLPRIATDLDSKSDALQRLYAEVCA